MSAEQDARRRFVILGGGIVGWLAAAALARALAPHQREITLIDHAPGTDAEIRFGPLVTAAPPFRLLLAILGMNEAQLMMRTGGAFRLGTHFTNWSPGGDYVHPYGEIGAPLEGVAFHQHWLRMQAFGEFPQLEDFSIAATAGRANKFAPPVADPSSVLSTLAYGLTFDADALALELRRYSEANGVRVFAGGYQKALLNGETGFIEALELSDDRKIEGDIFIDCSGVAARLIGATLSEPFEDWRQWFPVDRMLSAEARRASDPPILMRADAAETGWSWEVHGFGKGALGHCYASELCGREAAERALIRFGGGAPDGGNIALSEVSLSPGRRARFWVKNCIAIGPAAHVLDPVEGMGLHVAHTSLVKLIRLMPMRHWPQSDPDEYNRIMGEEVSLIRDFQLLHYLLHSGREGAFWRWAGRSDPPEVLAYKLDLFRARARVLSNDHETFETPSWISVLLGRGERPRRLDALSEIISRDATRLALTRMRDAMKRASDQMPSHGAVLARLHGAGRG